MKKQLSLTKLAVTAEHLQRDYFFKLYGKFCELCGDEAYCLDHCFSRSVKALFFEPNNLTRICKSCHFLKSKTGSGILRVYDHVKVKTGEQKFLRMWHTAKENKPFPDWNRVYILDKIDFFKEQLALLESGYTK